MYKLSVPVSLKLITDDNINIYLKQLKDIKAERVFLIGFGKLYTPESIIHSNPEKITKIMNILRNEGYEVGLWVSSFGHGHVLAQSTPSELDANYTSMEGVNGEVGAEALCPLDKSFERDFLDGVDKMAKLRPDILMFDDIYDEKVTLDKSYKNIKFANCIGSLEGDTVTLSHIPPYGFAAFEVEL